MPVSFVFVYVCPIAQHYRQRRAWKVSLLDTIWKCGKSTHDSVRPWSISQSEKAKERLCFIFSVVWQFTEWFKQKDSMLNTTAITAVTMFSMKPWSGATTNCQLHGSGERKVSFNRTIMQALELQRLVKRHILGQATFNSEETKPIALAVIELRLSESISQLVEKICWIRNFYNFIAT